MSITIRKYIENHELAFTLKSDIYCACIFINKSGEDYWKFNIPHHVGVPSDMIQLGLALLKLGAQLDTSITPEQIKAWADDLTYEDETDYTSSSTRREVLF